MVVGFGGIHAIDAELLYRVPIVDRGTIAAPFSDSETMRNCNRKNVVSGDGQKSDDKSNKRVRKSDQKVIQK